MYRVVGPKHKIVREFRTPFPPRYNRKNPRSVYVRVRRVMARRALCTIRSHGTKSHMLVSKLRSGTSKTKADPGELVRVVLFWKSHCATCSPAYVILYHVTGLCKEPIRSHRLIIQNLSYQINAWLSLLICCLSLGYRFWLRRFTAIIHNGQIDSTD